MVGDGGSGLSEALERDGHLMVRHALPVTTLQRALVAARAAIDRALAEEPDQREPGDVDYVTALRLCERSPALREVVCSPRLAEVAAAALGVPRVRLLYDQLFVKPPGATFTMWHQDQVYWPIDTSDVVAAGAVGSVRAWVTLTDLPAEVGGLHLVDGSHRSGPLRSDDIGIGPPGRDATATIHGREHAITGYGAHGAGDTTFHAGFTVHGARHNPTAATRYSVAIVYVPDGTRVAEPVDDQHALAIAMHTPHTRVGGVIASSTNPVLWPPDGV